MRSITVLLSLLLTHFAFAGEKTRDLFNGKDLSGWTITEFGGQGEVKVANGEIVAEAGASLTGVHYTNTLPKKNYELTLDAKKIDGSDFFCALTFPVNETHCTLVLGGWGGGVVGLSSIDGMDASENETTKYLTFKSDQWFNIRLRVEAERIQAWVDKERVVDIEIKGREVGLRFGPIDLQKPLGLSNYQTKSAWKNIKVTEVAAEKKSEGKSEKNADKE